MAEAKAAIDHNIQNHRYIEDDLVKLHKRCTEEVMRRTVALVPDDGPCRNARLIEIYHSVETVTGTGRALGETREPDTQTGCFMKCKLNTLRMLGFTATYPDQGVRLGRMVCVPSAFLYISRSHTTFQKTCTITIAVIANINHNPPIPS